MLHWILLFLFLQEYFQYNWVCTKKSFSLLFIFCHFILFLSLEKFAHLIAKISTERKLTNKFKLNSCHACVCASVSLHPLKRNDYPQSTATSCTTATREKSGESKTQTDREREKNYNFRCLGYSLPLLQSFLNSSKSFKSLPPTKRRSSLKLYYSYCRHFWWCTLWTVQFSF